MKKVYIDGEKTTVFSPKVVNNLTDGGTAKALSAEQGKTLKGLIDNIQAGSIDALTDTDISNKADGDVLQYDSTSSKWKNKPTTFTEASSRTNIASGDTLSTIFGKIKKFFSDLKTVAFTGAYSDLTGQPTNVSTFYNDANYITSADSCAYATSAGSAGSAGITDQVGMSGTKGSGTGGGIISGWQGDTSYFGSTSEWQSVLIMNHGDGASYFHQMLRFPFFNDNFQIQRMSGGVLQGWRTLIHDGNIGNYATQTHVYQGLNTVVQVVSSGNDFAYTISATDEKLKQENCGTNQAYYRVLLSYTGDSTTRTETALKTDGLVFNPYWGALHLRGTNCGLLESSARQQFRFAASDETTYRLFLGVHDNLWTLCPDSNAQLRLGSPSYKWGQIYSNSGVIDTSDRNAKKDIEELDEFARTLIMSLKPVSYKFIDGTSGRTHYGMIAQDIEDSFEELGITATDLAAFCKDQKCTEKVVEKDTDNEHVESTPIEGEYIYGLRYEEFISPMIKTIQLQQKEIEELKKRLDALEKVKE